MMKKMMLVAAVAAAVAAPAIACDGSEGFSCNNECPLAQKANTLRSTGRESMTVSTVVRAQVAAQVERNLARI
jgi:hypothetical protein